MRIVLKVPFIVWFCVQIFLGTCISARDANSLKSNNTFTTGKSYIVINKSRTFLEAWRFCASIGLRLATVTSAEESRLLDQAVNGTGNVPAGSTWWIGGTNLGREGSFIWISTNLPVGYKTGYFNFSPGQPDNYKGVENCLEIGRFGPTMWNDMPCDTKLHFVCEYCGLREK
uniref:C-type lectin domain-containing protein n=1 Tax=Anopheles atroparvus TaxID=41427 RepID=A0AAG5D1K9_ANOAO